MTMERLTAFPCHLASVRPQLHGSISSNRKNADETRFRDLAFSFKKIVLVLTRSMAAFRSPV